MRLGKGMDDEKWAKYLEVMRKRIERYEESRRSQNAMADNYMQLTNRLLEKQANIREHLKWLLESNDKYRI